MTTAATSLLGLALPVTGELSGVWGQTVNDSITTLLDSAVAGTTTLSTDADVTLTTTTLAANQARQAILLCSGARTALRTITAPAQSKIYTIINATTGGFSVKLVGVGPTTGLTIPNGASAVVAWNGSDFIEVGSATVGNLTVNGNLSVTGTTSLTGVATLTANPVLSAGTANGVAYLNGSKVVTTGSALTFDGTNLGIGVTASAWGSAYKTLDLNTVGAISSTTTSLNLLTNAYHNGTNFIYKTSTGATRYAATTGGAHIWYDAASGNAGDPITFTEQMRLTSTGLGIGTSSPSAQLQLNKSGTGDYTTFRLSNSGASGKTFEIGVGGNTAAAGYANSLYFYDSTAGALRMTLDSSGNLGLGVTPSAWWSSTKTMQIGAGGVISGRTDTAARNYFASNAYLNATPAWTYITTNYATRYEQNDGQHQWYSAASGTAGNTISFTQPMTLDASGNLLIGTTSSDGSRLRVYGSYQTLGDGSYEGLIGKASSLVSGGGTGEFAIRSSSNLLFATNGNTERARIDSSGNLLVGVTSAGARFQVQSSGSTSSTYCTSFLNNGGFPLFDCRDDGRISTGSRGVSPYNNTTASAANMYVDSSGILYRSTSSLKYKTNVKDTTRGLSDLLKLRAVTYEGKSESDEGKTFGGLIAEEVHEAGLTEFVQYAEDGTPDALAYGNMVSLLVKAIQEQQSIIVSMREELDALKTKVGA